MLVVKKIETAHMSDQEKTQASREVELHTDLRHQHIVQYISHFVEDSTLHIVMQYVKEKEEHEGCLCGEWLWSLLWSM
jgi:serine/threonine protein kinase